jgi:hypothetical protein
MLASEECALAEAISDRLIKLYVRRDEARRHDNLQDAGYLQDQIEEASAERNELLSTSREK